MATKKSIADDDFSFLNGIKVNDRYADKRMRHPDFGFVDSGSYALNGLLCGDIFGGFPRNRFIMVAGQQGSGKSYIGKNNYCYNLLQEGYYIFYYDTEGETTEEDLETQNGFIPGHYRLIKEPTTVEQFFISVNGIIDALEEDRGDSIEIKRKVAFILDSQGQLSTEKAINDATKGEIKQDMTKAKQLAGMYRSITNRCANLGIPMFITNHVYMDPGAMFGNPEKIAGGEGAKFSASIILNLFKTFEKASEKDSKEVLGVVLHATVTKSRLVKQGLRAPIYLDYKYGLDRYYGLHQIAMDAGLIEEFKASKYPDLTVPLEKDGTKTRKKCYVIKDPNKDPSQWLVCKLSQLRGKNTIGTILEPINEYVKATYKYRPPCLRVDEEIEFDEDELAAAEQKARAAMDAEVAKTAEMLRSLEVDENEEN
ncbi:MAG: hypothetical protein MJZ25_03865 [Fibrobacter sp.]|nr:hypothetical protein [Fibrobacter sp.]